MNVQLINGNCIDEIKKINKCKLLLTDIPYEEVNRNDNGLRNLNKGKADIKTFELDTFLDTIYDKADTFIIFCGQNQLSTIFNYFNNKQKAGGGLHDN